jgi:hypothetical protein
MSDLISRKETIDILYNYKRMLFDGVSDPVIYGVQGAIEVIKTIPCAVSTAEWIPCSERLPRARESVLLAVNHKYGDWVGEGCYWETTDNHTIWKGYRWNATYWDDEIIAWMQLQEPWKGADDE